MGLNGNYWQRTASRRAVLRGASVGAAGLAGAALIGCSGDDDPTATPDAGGGGGGGGGAAATATTAPETTTGETFVPAPPYSIAHPEVTNLLNEFSAAQLKDRLNPRTPQRGGVPQWGFSEINRDWNFTEYQDGSTDTVLSYTHNNLLAHAEGIRANSQKILNTTDHGVAESFEIEDPTTYVFNLRKNVKYWDVAPVNGRIMTAEDVAFDFAVYKDAPPSKSTFDEVVRTEAIDDFTVKITMQEPASYFIGNMGNIVTPIFAPEHFEAGTLGETPIGTGPFQLEAFERGRHSIYKAHPEYFMKAPDGGSYPLVDGINGAPRSDGAGNLAAYRTDQHDIMGFDDLETFELLRDEFPDDNFQVIPWSLHGIHHILMDNTVAPFDDVRVRRAMSMAINRQSIIDDAWGGAGMPGAEIPFDLRGEDWEELIEDMGEWYQYDPDKAKALLDAAGYGDSGIDVTMTTGSAAGYQGSAINFVIEDLKAIGINVNLNVVTGGEAFGAFFGRTYTPDIMYMNCCPNLKLEADGWAYDGYHSSSATNLAFVSDPEIDRLAVAQRRAVVPEERQEILQDMNLRMLDQVYKVYIGRTFRYNVWKAYVHDIQNSNYLWAAQAGGKQWAESWMEGVAAERTLGLA